MKKILLLTILIPTINFSSIGQTNAESKLGAWYMYGGSHQLSNKWTLKSLVHFRMFKMVNDLQQFLFRAGGNYQINKNLNVTAGYAYLNTDITFNQDGGASGEHRIYEDFIIKHGLSKLKLHHRFRLEHRFFQHDTQHWIRYEIGGSYPINGKWSAFLFDELFINFQNDTFAQNWLGGGFTYKATEKIKYKVGYMNIMLSNANFHRILLGVAFNTSFKSKN